MTSRGVFGCQPIFGVLCCLYFSLHTCVSPLTDLLAGDPRLGGLEATLLTCNEHLSTVKLQVGSEDTEIRANMTHLLNWEGRVEMAEGGL